MPRPRLRTATRLLAEMGVIIFSVLLALGVNEWRQAQSRKSTVNAVLEAIRTEAESNHAQLTRALEHHTELLDQLRSGGMVMARFHAAQAGLDTTENVRLAQSLASAVRTMGAPIRGDFEAYRMAAGGWRIEHEQGLFELTVQGDTAVIRGTGNIALQPPFLVDYAWETAQLTQAAVHMDPALVASLARIRQLQNSFEGTVSRLVDMLYGTSAHAGFTSGLQDLVSFERELVRAYEALLEQL